MKATLITQMDRQLYDNLMHYLTELTYPDGLTQQRKTYLRKTSTQYIVKNNLLFQKDKTVIKRVILREQVESILYNLHQDMSGAYLGIGKSEREILLATNV